MGWVSPTGFVDSGNVWSNETLAYNDDVENFCAEYSSAIPTEYLELTHAALSCDKVRFYTSIWASTHTLDLDVYYDAAWHNIYSADPLGDQYIEVEIGSTQSVTAMRIRAAHSAGSHCVNDTDFNEVEALPPSWIPKIITVS